MDVRQFAGQTLDFRGSEITVVNLNKGNGGVAVNFTGSSSLNIRGLRLVCGDAGADIGVLFSRCRSEGGDDANNIKSSHVFRVDDLCLLGKYRLAALYSIASESNIFVGGRWENQLEAGLFTAYFCHHKPTAEYEQSLVGYHEFPPDGHLSPVDDLNPGGDLIQPAGLPMGMTWAHEVLPYDATNEQLPQTAHCSDTAEGYNPPDATVHGNELFGVTIVCQVNQGDLATGFPKGALYLRSAGVFSLHGARIESSSAPYLVMHAAGYQPVPNSPLCGTHTLTTPAGPGQALGFGVNDVGPLVVRNLVGRGIGPQKPLVALRTIGADCPFPVGPGQHAVDVELSARMLETSGSSSASELLVGRNFLRGHLVLPGSAGVACSSRAVIAAEIELRGMYGVPADFELARKVVGRLRVGALVTCPENPPGDPTFWLTMPATQPENPCALGADPEHRGIVRSFHPNTPRTRHVSPLSITSRTTTALAENEAVVWVQQGQIKLKLAHKVNGQLVQRCKTFPV
jgi:hypothetical protein